MPAEQVDHVGTMLNRITGKEPRQRALLRAILAPWPAASPLPCMCALMVIRHTRRLVAYGEAKPYRRGR